MRKFIIIIVFLLILLGGSAAWYFMYYLQQPQSVTFTSSENPLFKAVPIHSPLIIELPDAGKTFRSFSEGNAIINELNESEIKNELTGNIQFINNLRNSNTELDRLLTTRTVLISVNFEGKNDVDYIYYASLADKKEQSVILGIIRQINNASDLSKRNYDNAEIYRTTINNTTFSFAFTNGMFIASRKPILVEESIRQSGAENLTDFPEFEKLSKTSNPNALVNIYINHESAGQLLAKILNRDIRKKIGILRKFAEWSELDLNLKNDELFLSGYTFANDSAEKYINLFKSQAPVKSDIETVLPSNTSAFLSIGIENIDRFMNDYEEYSRVAGSYYQREARLMVIKKETKIDILEVINELATGVTGIAFTTVMQNEPGKNRFFIMETKGQSASRGKMESLLNKYTEKKAIDAKNQRTEYRIDEKRSFTFYRFPYPDLSEILFGSIYSGVQCNFFTLYDKYLIFADSQPALKDYIHNLVLGETLSKDINYLKFKENTSSKSNLNFYLNFSKAFHLSKLYLNDEKLDEWQKSEENIRKFYAFSWQFSNTNNLILNSIYVKFDPLVKEEPQTVWQAKLESNILTRPQMVINHNDPNNKEVIFQDQANNLYLINKEGVTLWKIKLQEPIISDITQIDIYRNNKYQYLFSTKSQIHLIDRNGEKVKGFPVALRSPATNGVSVVDYDNNKDYRFFISCEDKQVYAYTRDGKFVKGWNKFTSDNVVEKPIQHIRVLNKDYLVFFDRYKTYFIDRQGKERLQTKATFEHSKNEFVFESSPKPAVVCTDTKGVIYKLFFDGNFEKIEAGTFSSDHFFTSSDIDGNGLNDFIFADGNKLFVYSESGKQLFSKEFKNPISEKPELFSFGNQGIKTGIVSAGENQVYLFNANGSLYHGFPLQGNSRFCIGTISKGNKFRNLMIGNEDGSFFNYMIE